jgi:uridine phosphorylase
MKVFSVALAMASIFLSSAAMAVSVGFYAGTFDPPTQSQLKMIRCALGDAGLHRACAEIGKQISRVVVLVSEDSEKETIASTRERILMLRKALEKHADRVEIVAATTSQAEDKRRALLENKNIEQLFQLVSADSDKELQSSPGSRHPKVVWLTFPLEDGATSKGPVMDRLGGSGATEVIEKLGLYQDISEDLADLQRSLFEESWKDFLKDLNSACPISINQTACSDLASRWEAIPVVATDDSTKRSEHKESSAKTQLSYNPSQSEDRWAEKFVATALQLVDGSEAYDRLKPVAEDISARVFQGYPYGKLSRLRRASPKKDASSIGPFQVSHKPVACSAPQGTYNADMDQYLADRFPKAFSAFLKERIDRPSSLPIDLYVHNHPVEAAYEFHRRDGYATFYLLQTRRGQSHRDIYLAVKSQPLAYRVVLTSVRGNDRRANVLCQIYRTGVFSNYRFVQSRKEQPLFVFNLQGDSLRLNRDDWLLFGFKGNWTRRLRAQNWQQQPLVKEGLDIDLFTHPAIKRKIVVARNVYGDDGQIILDTFYKKGIRQVLYLGSAGAIADYQIGDVVIPNEFTDLKHNVVPFEKNFARAYRSEIGSLVNVHADKKHGWVQSLFDETTDVLLDWRARSVVSVDIEGLHLARFAETHRDLKIAALFVISDLALGDVTIEDTNAMRGVIDDSVDKLMSFFFPKVVEPNASFGHR